MYVGSWDTATVDESGRRVRLRPTGIGRRWPWALLVLAGLWGGVQLRDSLSDGGDSSTIFFAARAMLDHRNPYDAGTLRAIAETQRLGLKYLPNPETTPSVYPPSTLVLYLPLTALPWGIAGPLCFGIGLLLAVAMIPALLRLVPDTRASPACFVLAACVLALGPQITALKTKQPSIPATLLIIVSLALERSRRPNLAGLALGLSLAFKPQLGLPLIGLWGLIGRCRLTAVALLVAAGLNVAGVAMLWQAEGDWFGSWKANLALANDKINSVAVSNSLRFQLIDLRIVYGSIVGANPPSSLTLATTGCLALEGLISFWMGRTSRDLPAFAIAFLILGLIGTYHRYFDATLLLIPLAWAFGAWMGGRRRIAVAVILLLAPFSLSVDWILDSLEQQRFFPGAIVQAWWWRAIVKPCQVWCLVTLYGVFLLESLHPTRRGADSSAAEGSPLIAVGSVR